MLSRFRDICHARKHRENYKDELIKRYRLLYLASIRFKWDCDFSNPLPYSFHYPPAIFPEAHETRRNSIALPRKQSVQFPHLFCVIPQCSSLTSRPFFFFSSLSPFTICSPLFPIQLSFIHSCLLLPLSPAGELIRRLNRPSAVPLG